MNYLLYIINYTINFFNFSGILTNMQKGIFVVHLFILQKVLTMINILSNQLQSKTATLGNAANVIKSVIKSFEGLRNPVAFSQMWKEILQFCEDHNSTIEKPF
jgi:hypothetical protein